MKSSQPELGVKREGEWDKKGDETDSTSGERALTEIQLVIRVPGKRASVREEAPVPIGR